jgi:hypothetical protein
MSARGRRFVAGQDALATRVGGAWFHGLSDRRSALAQLDRGFASLAMDLASAPPTIVAALSPTISTWQRFEQTESTSTIAPWITAWDVFAIWRERLIWARMAARAAGVTLTGPEPPLLPSTVFERGESGMGDSVDRGFVLGRNVIKIGLGAIAVIGVWKAISNFRHDAAEMREQVHEAIADEIHDDDEHEEHHA